MGVKSLGFVAFVLVICTFVNICECLRSLEDPKDVIGMNAARRTYYKDAEYTDLGKEYTRGSIWPKPLSESRDKGTVYRIYKTSNFFTIEQNAAATRSDSHPNLGVLTNAILRYTELTFPNKNIEKDEDDDEHEVIENLLIKVTDFSEELNQDSHENYKLVIKAETSTLEATSVWGALRGLETFSQIVTRGKGHYKVFKNVIIDKPRFQYRGFLIDTSRHFLPVSKIFQFLDAMSYSKFNVLHWHIVDDPSFPYVSKTFPSLSAKGAFTEKHVYTQNNISQIIQYARLRGIRVMPEFDTPGHVHSWKGAEGLRTECGTTSLHEEMFSDLKGPLNPVRPSTYEFISKLFGEIAEVFPEKFLHLGGDEVDFQCWESNTGDIKEWLTTNNKQVIDLHTYYLNKLVEITTKLKKTNVVWQEVFDDGVKISPGSTIVNVWKQENWKEEMNKVTKAGFDTILSSPWYLNYISYGLDWPKFYKADPHEFGGTDTQKGHVIGGSACMWGEYVDATNVIQRSFGRSFAVAERLWSSKDTVSVKAALPRIWEHRCRYLSRGLPAEPVTKAKFCANEWTS